MMFVIANSLADSAQKILFLGHAQLGVMEMLFLRSIFVLVLMGTLIGTKVKYYMWTSIPPNMTFPLLSRCATGLLAFFCMTTAIKHLPIVLVALIQNTIPIFTSLFGFLILGEKISRSEILCLILAFIGVYMLITSKNSEDNKTADQKEN